MCNLSVSELLMRQCQESRRDTALILACMLAASTVIHAQEANSSDTNASLDEAREVSKCLSQKLGMSTKDLPGPLHQKFQAIGTATKGSGETLVGSGSLWHSCRWAFLADGVKGGMVWTTVV